MTDEQEAIDRGDFKTIQAKTWVPDIQKCIQTAVEIASAMAYLHSCDILHSDLSANNILLAKHDGRIMAKVSIVILEAIGSTGQSDSPTPFYPLAYHEWQQCANLSWACWVPVQDQKMGSSQRTCGAISLDE